MIARVTCWGRTIGAVSDIEGTDVVAFEYAPDFLNSGIQLSPIHMPLSDTVYSFPRLARDTFHGLPGLLADSLPDRFGNLLINAWLAAQGRPADSLSPVERLCYTGSRGMGALEFEPVMGPSKRVSDVLHVDRLVRLASDVLSQRVDLSTHLEEIDDILRVGTSAGGARAKAVIAWNPTTNEVRSGQSHPGDGFDHWLIKFDGVDGNRDKETVDPRGYGVVEYAYYRMAIAAGITMSDCRLFEENGRRHFMTRRFDRGQRGEKLHMQTLGALAHFDYNQAGAYSYEQAFEVMRRLRVPMTDAEEMFRRMVFNVLARNQDDHVKNIAFLMDRSGTWSLAPAYDMSYNHNPDGAWTSSHQMTIQDKRDGFTRADLIACANVVGIRAKRADAILRQVADAVSRWTDVAHDAGVTEAWIGDIGRAHRVLF